PPRAIRCLGRAAEVARGVADKFADGVWLVELAGVRDPAQVPSVVAAARGCGSSRGSNAFTTTDGSNQAVVLVHADGLSLQQQNDIFNAVAIGICGSG